MKPVVTWALLANARHAKVLENRGPGKGLVPLEAHQWEAGLPEQPRDRAGMGHSIGGPGVSAVEQADPQRKADRHFAKVVGKALTKAFLAQEFDRLILVAGPHMLGLLRDEVEEALAPVIAGEIDKDLMAQPDKSVEAHVGEIIAV